MLTANQCRHGVDERSCKWCINERRLRSPSYRRRQLKRLAAKRADAGILLRLEAKARQGTPVTPGRSAN